MTEPSDAGVPLPPPLAGVPLPSPMAGVTWRALGADDASALHALIRAYEIHDSQPYVTTLEEVGHSMSDVQLDLARDTIGGWAPDGRLACFGAARGRAAAVRRRIAYQDGHVHPDWRRRGLGYAVMAWTEARSRQLLARSAQTEARSRQLLARSAQTEARSRQLLARSAQSEASLASVPAFLEVYADERLADRRALYERRGYRAIRYYADMRRNLAEALPDVDLPAGLAELGWSAETDEQFRVAHVTAFEDHWGSEPLTPDEWQLRFTGAPSFRPDLSVGVLDGGRLVGYVLSYHAPSDTQVTGRVQGWLGQVGTLRDWRGRGVASALMVRVMHRMRDAGFDDAMLDVDTDNTSGAVGLYERLGFRPEHRFVRWEKPA